jgi:hypothetical protein
MIGMTPHELKMEHAARVALLMQLLPMPELQICPVMQNPSKSCAVLHSLLRFVLSPHFDEKWA